MHLMDWKTEGFEEVTFFTRLPILLANAILVQPEKQNQNINISFALSPGAQTEPLIMNWKV